MTSYQLYLQFDETAVGVVLQDHQGEIIPDMPGDDKVLADEFSRQLAHAPGHFRTMQQVADAKSAAFPAMLKETALRFCGQRGLDPLFSDALARIREILLPSLGTLTVDQRFYEDYTVYITDRDDPALDPVVILLGDERPVSHPVREDLLKYSLSYYMDDRTILSWDAALIVSPEPARESSS